MTGYSYNDRSERASADCYFGSNLKDSSDPGGTRSFDHAYDDDGNLLTDGRWL